MLKYDKSKGLASMNRPFQDKLDLVMCSAHNSAHSFLLPVCHHHPFLLPRFRIHPIIIGGMLEHAGAGGRERRKSGDVAQTQASVPGKRRGRVKYMQHTFKHKPGEGRGGHKRLCPVTDLPPTTPAHNLPSSVKAHLCCH